MLRSISNIASIPLLDNSKSFIPHSFRKAMATSMESSVGLSTSSVRISRAMISCAWKGERY